MLPQFRPIALATGLFANKSPGDWQHQEFADWMKLAIPEFSRPPVFPTLPKNAPKEAPRVILLDERKRTVLEVGPAKVTIRCAPSPGVRTLDEWFPIFLDLVSKIVSQLTEYGWGFIRIGFVVTLFREFGSSANERIVQYFFRHHDLFEPEPHDVQLHVLTRLAPERGPLVNRWVRLKPLRRSPGSQDFAIQVEIDLNTLPESASNKSLQDIKQFLAVAKDHVSDDIGFLNDDTF